MLTGRLPGRDYLPDDPVDVLQKVVELVSISGVVHREESGDDVDPTVASGSPKLLPVSRATEEELADAVARTPSRVDSHPPVVEASGVRTLSTDVRKLDLVGARRLDPSPDFGGAIGGENRFL